MAQIGDWVWAVTIPMKYTAILIGVFSTKDKAQACADEHRSESDLNEAHVSERRIDLPNWRSDQ